MRRPTIAEKTSKIAEETAYVARTSLASWAIANAMAGDVIALKLYFPSTRRKSLTSITIHALKSRKTLNITIRNLVNDERW